jgi:hypothetical protein
VWICIQKQRLVSIHEHPWVFGQAMGTLTHKTHHSPDSGEATTFSHIVFFAAHGGGYIQMAHFVGTPKIVSVGVQELWELITPGCRVQSQQGLNQSCSPSRDLSNTMLHFQFGCQEKVDSRLLVVGSQTASSTPNPSFAHNLGCRCPNDQCEAIFDIYASRPFPMTLRTPQCERCFGPCCRALNIWEFRRTPNPQLWKCWASPPHLAKVGCDISIFKFFCDDVFKLQKIWMLVYHYHYHI